MITNGNIVTRKPLKILIVIDQQIQILLESKIQQDEKKHMT